MGSRALRISTMHTSLLLVALGACLALGSASPFAQCVKSCKGVSDGYYQSCSTCNGYVVCKGQRMTTMRCKEGGSWDDNTERCEEHVPTTCFGACTDSCSKLPDGNYHMCSGACDRHMVCWEGRAYSYSGYAVENQASPFHHSKNYYKKCSSKKVYDDLYRECRYTSTTCNRN